MEENFKKLDDFLRKHLNDASENRAWNVPDDSIFEKAMRTVADEKRKKRRGWILIPVLLVSALIVSEYLHTRQIEKLRGEITTLESNLTKEHSGADPLASNAAKTQEANSPLSATPSEGIAKSNTPASEGISNPSTDGTTNPNTTSSPTTRDLTNGSTPNTKISVNGPANANPVASETNVISREPRQKSTTNGNANTNNANAIPLPSGSKQSINADPSNNIASAPGTPDQTAQDLESTTYIADNTFAAGWVTDPITALVLTGVAREEAMISPPLVSPGVSNQSKPIPVYALQYGLVMGVNQSWLTMKNIPATPDANLYDYDNSQPGFSMSGFVNKPFSRKFSLQGGLSYNVYNNQSILEDQFLLDSDHVTQMPDGQIMYQTDYDVINPLGDYDMLLEFRVSDEMHENDVMVEYTTIKQTIRSLALDLGIHYDLLTLGDFKVSLGTGLGLGYRSGLTNEFNISTYHNGILQKNQMETPDHLDNLNRWYGLWLGNLNLAYYPTDRLGIILVTQYNGGITSIRDGGSANGPLTFLHAWSLSAGVTHSF